MLLVVVGAVAMVNLTGVQNFIARKAAAMLSTKLHTRVSVKKVRIDMLNHLMLQGVFVGDQNGDTLLYAGKLQVHITDWLFHSYKPKLHYLELQKAFVRLYRPDSTEDWNYKFLADILGSPPDNDTTKSTPFEFGLERIILKNVRFHMDDARTGWDMDYDLGSLDLDAKRLDVKQKALRINELTIEGANVALRTYKGGRANIPDTVKVADFSPFNPDNWLLKVKTLNLYDCRFSLNFNSKVPNPGEFDPDHMEITGIDLHADNCKIVGDTIFADIKKLKAKDRCGVMVKTLQAKVSISPIASVCDNLYLETGYSKMKHYYAMHYKHFPSFLNYNDSVEMVGHMKDAVIDSRDIAYFAPLLRKLPQVTLKMSGDGHGTVANLNTKNLDITDGTTKFKGSGSIVGLPDFFKSTITVDQGEIFTSGAGIFKYLPDLRYQTDIGINALDYAYFKGSFVGKPDNFLVTGTLNSSLGTVATHMNMELPGFKVDSAKYYGTVSVSDFQAGKLFNIKNLGNTSFDLTVSGKSFNANVAEVTLDGNIYNVAWKGYQYKDITTHGTIAAQQFDGHLTVDDLNLGLVFNGSVDFSAEMVNIKAKATLSHCNFKNLNLTDDEVTAAAVFDFNCTGSNLDNFHGYARLDDIKLRKNSSRVSLDSVLVRASGDNAGKTIQVQSNDISAKIKGDFKLSKLPASFQYYLAAYLPSFINAPEISSLDQNIEFVVNTVNIDELLAITYPTIRGFDGSYLSGMLNTGTQKLSLVASVPFGTIGKVHLSNVSVSCIGNLNSLNVNTTIDNVAIGDSSLSGSVGLTASLANDSMRFSVATTTPDTSTSIVLNGMVITKQDSIYLTLAPSSFYLNQLKWDIAGDCRAVYSGNYLYVNNLAMSSGLQKITAGYAEQGADQVITVNTENLDLGQLGGWAGLAYLQPDGRVNGTVKIKNPLRAAYISADFKANDVKLGTDTLGDLNIIGDYDNMRKMVIIDPQTGIYFNGSSLTASGKVSFDSNINQQLDGMIKFANVPVSWASPFVSGIFSRMSGKVNGAVAIGGKSYSPDIEGDVKIQNCGFKLDYMGVSYSIPKASVHIDNTHISFDSVRAFDGGKNAAVVTGCFYHNLFRDMRMHIKLQSKKIEVMHLSKTENNYFYGSVTAGMDSFIVSGPFSNISLNAYNLYPAAKSRIFLPMQTTGDAGAYNYVSFKNYGKTPEKPVKHSATKLNIGIDANLNDLADISILLDPSSDDAIDAKGDGNIQLNMPADNDMRIAGNFNIESGTYSFTFKQLKNFKKQFKLNSGSTIYFKGPFNETTVDVFATYPAKARLMDLLSTTEQAALTSTSDIIDAKRIQPIDIVLHMQDNLFNPKLSFDMNVEDKRMENNPAYAKLVQINQDDRQKFDQVASLLLTGNFLSQEGLFGTGSVTSGAINNFSQILSSTASSTLTGVVNKLVGENKVNINVNYQNYSIADAGITTQNRNQFTGTISQNYLNDRLTVEIGGKSDFGHATGGTGAVGSLNITGDFKIQYLVSPASHLRLNCFSTNDFDATLEKSITRNGVGVSWRKSFDNVQEFFNTKQPAAPHPTGRPVKDSTRKASAGKSVNAM